MEPEYAELAHMELDFTWQYLATTTGASAAALLITQLFKEYLPIPTRFFVVGVSFLVLLAAGCFSGQVQDTGDVLLILLNSFSVAMAAVGTYDTLHKPTSPRSGGETRDTDPSRTGGI